MRRFKALRLSRPRKITFLLMLTILILLAPSVFAPENVTGNITYQLQWQWGDAIPLDDGWMVRNDLGYRVHVTKGYSVAYSTQLLYCEHSHGLFDWVGKIFAVSVVHAGHNTGDQDPASVLVSLIESLDKPQTSHIGTVTVNEPGYCKAHFLVAPGSDDTPNMPSDKDMFGVSLYIEGTYQSDDMPQAQPFRAQTSLGNGKNLPLIQADDASQKSVHVEIGNTPVKIGIIRQLDSLFDGADFATMDEEELGKAILWQMMADLRIVVLSGVAH